MSFDFIDDPYRSREDTLDVLQPERRLQPGQPSALLDHREAQL
jgi:hypothetical protein